MSLATNVPYGLTFGMQATSSRDEPSNVSGTRAKDKSELRRTLSNIGNVVTVLQGLAECHPYAKACVATFGAVLKFELERRENDEHIVVVFKSMSNMAETMRLVTPAIMQDDALSLRVKAALDAMEDEMVKFGTFSIQFYASRISRLFRANEYKAQLQGFAEAFARHQNNMVAVLTVRTASTTQDILDSVTALSAHTEHVRRTLDDIGGQRLLVNDHESEGTSADLAAQTAEFLLQLNVARSAVYSSLRHCEPAVDSTTATVPTDAPITVTGEAGLEIANNMLIIEGRLKAMASIVDRIDALLSCIQSAPASPSPSRRLARMNSVPGGPTTRMTPPPESQSTPRPPPGSSSPPGRLYSGLLNHCAQLHKHSIDIDATSTGPDHALVWTVYVKVDNEIRGVGTNMKKVEAKEIAARAACAAMYWSL